MSFVRILNFFFAEILWLCIVLLTALKKSFFALLFASVDAFEAALDLSKLGHVLVQTLTRVSISRNSRREMTQIFLSRLREANFHVSFCSRFSRIGGKVSLSPLDFQDLKKFSSRFETNFSFSSRFSRIWRKFLRLLSIFKIFLINILIIDHWAWYVKICFYPFII